MTERIFILPPKRENGHTERTASRPRLAAATNAAGASNLIRAALRLDALRAEDGSRSGNTDRLRPS